MTAGLLLDAVDTAFANCPPEAIVAVEVEDPVGGTKERSEAIAVPESSPGDGFVENVEIRAKTRRLSVRARGLTKGIRSGWLLRFGGQTYSVLLATPFPELAPVLYRVTVER